MRDAHQESYLRIDPRESSGRDAHQESYLRIDPRGRSRDPQQESYLRIDPGETILDNPILNELQKHLQVETSGGMHTAPEARLIMASIAKGMHAQDILETGYDAGYTTLAFAQTGAANVVGIDNRSEYPESKDSAREMLKGYPNVHLLFADALEFLKETADDSFDIIFIDDSHKVEHVFEEALQVKRVLRPGGYAFFHDTNVRFIFVVMQAAFQDWPIINLPAYSPVTGEDFGLGMTRKQEKMQISSEYVKF